MPSAASRAICQFLLAGLLLLNAASPAMGERGMPAENGISHFGQVTALLYRGAQPDQEGVRRLKVLGIKTIISLREPGNVSIAEESQARASGILYTNIPMTGFGAPRSEQVERVLGILVSCPGPVFVHCRHGADRTGTVVACFRIRQQGWNHGQALAEAKAYGFSKLQVGMKRFIADFAISNTPNGRFSFFDRPELPKAPVKLVRMSGSPSLDTLETNNSSR